MEIWIWSIAAGWLIELLKSAYSGKSQEILLITIS